MYRVSEKAFKEVELYLSELLDTPELEVAWQVSDSRKFAYALRQGFKAAAKLEKPRFADLRNLWMITEKENAVVAKKRTLGTVIPIGIHKKSFEGVISLSQLITTIIDNKHLNYFHFPNLLLTVEEANNFQKWLNVQNLEYNADSKELKRCPKIETKQSESQSK